MESLLGRVEAVIAVKDGSEWDAIKVYVHLKADDPILLAIYCVFIH